VIHDYHVRELMIEDDSVLKLKEEKDIHMKMNHDQHNRQERCKVVDQVVHLIQILLKDHNIVHEYLQQSYNHVEDI
jgi:hypothetical protein